MTTIIVVVVVALVFFVAVCVVTFMVWKRESEMRTDSIKAIEQNLEKLAYGLSQDSQADGQAGFGFPDNGEDDMSYMESIIAESSPVKVRKKKSYDPFGWVRESDNKIRSNENNEAEQIYQAMTETSETGNDTEMDFPLCEYGEKYDMPEEKSPGDMESDSDTVESAEQEILVSETGELTEAVEADDMTEMTETSESDESDEALKEMQEFSIELENEVDEISLDFMDKIQQIEIEQTDRKEEVEAEASKYQMGYDVGRSGRKYTASELETLIKE